MRRSVSMAGLLMVWAVAVLCCTTLYAQESSPLRNLGAIADTATLYPSLTKVAYIGVNYYDPVEEVIKRTGLQRSEVLDQLRDKSAWVVRESKDAPNLPIIADVVIPRAGSPNEDVAYLYLKPGSVEEETKVEIGVRIGTATYMHSADGKSATPITLKPVEQLGKWEFTQTDAAKQELFDGTKKDLVHFGIKYENTSLMRSAHASLTSDNTISTDSRDKAAKLQLKYGIERSLSRRHYRPVSGSVELLSSQSLTNSSLIAGLDHSFRIANWGSIPVFSGGTIHAPRSPAFSVALQYENRLRQDPLLKPSHAAKDVGRIAAKFEWEPIYLFAGKKYDPRTTEKYSALQILAQTWRFLGEEAAPGGSARRTENYLKATLTVPMSLFGFQGTKNVRLQLAYETGAHEATGFSRSNEFTYGFVFTKSTGK